MILRLVKRDPAWQLALPLAVAMTMAAPLFNLGDALDLVLLPTVAIIVCSVRVRPHVHATLFEAALPIAGRDLFLARTLSLLAMVWLPVLCGAAGILLVRGNGPRALAMLGTGAIVTPVILAQQGIGIRECAGPRWSGFVWVPIWVAGGLAWHFLTHWVVLSLSGLVSAAILIRTWFAVPPSYQVASLDVIDPIAVPESAPAVPMARTAFTWLPILRSACSGVTAVYFGLMVLQGTFGGWFYFFCVFVVQGAAKSRQRTRWLSGLPLSYPSRLGITLVSAVVPLLAGLAIGMCISPSREDNSMEAGPGRKASLGMNVPLEFWHYAPDGKVPGIQAPWGETVQPATFRAAGFTFYNPYSINLGSSVQLHDWQLGRATEAVYGRSIPAAQYFAVRQSGSLKPRTGGALMQILTLEATALFALLLVLAIKLARWHRLHRLSAAARAILLSMLFGVPIAAAYGIDMYYMLHHSISIGQALAHFVLLRVTSALPNPLLAVSAAAVPVWAMYWLLERQFGRSELTMRNRPGKPE